MRRVAYTAISNIRNPSFLIQGRKHHERIREEISIFLVGAGTDPYNARAKQAVQNGATLLVFPEDAFFCAEASCNKFIEQAQGIAKENGINILLPLLRLPENGKKKNTLNFIDRNGQLVSTYLKNHLVPVVEEPETEKGDGKTPVIEVDGVKYTYLICADYKTRSFHALLFGIYI